LARKGKTLFNLVKKVQKILVSLLEIIIHPLN